MFLGLILKFHSCSFNVWCWPLSSLYLGHNYPLAMMRLNCVCVCVFFFSIWSLVSKPFPFHSLFRVKKLTHISFQFQTKSHTPCPLLYQTHIGPLSSRSSYFILIAFLTNIFYRYTVNSVRGVSNFFYLPQVTGDIVEPQ